MRLRSAIIKIQEAAVGEADAAEVSADNPTVYP